MSLSAEHFSTSAPSAVVQGSISDAGFDWDQGGIVVDKSSERKGMLFSDEGGTTSVGWSEEVDGGMVVSEG